MKKQLFILMVLAFAQFAHGDFNDYAVAQTVTANKAAQTAATSVQPTTPANAAATQDCSLCPSDATVSTAIPAFSIAILDSASNVLASIPVTPSSSFTVNNATLTVNIFPPSTSATDGSYYVVYTLTSLSGSVTQKQILPAPASPQTAPLAFKTMPASVSIYNTGVTLTANSPAPSGALATSTFMPSAFTTPAQQTQFLNIISPVSQEFLITQSSGSITASSTFGSIESASTASITLLSSGATTGNATVTITVSVSDGSSPQTLTFNGVYFSPTDLQKGLCLTTHIFPPSSSGSNYLLIATLKTLDGYKIQKQIMHNVSFTNLPSSISIAYAGTAITSYNFLDSTATSSSAFNTKSPVVIKTILQSHGGTVTALML